LFWISFGPAIREASYLEYRLPKAKKIPKIANFYICILKVHLASFPPAFDCS